MFAACGSFISLLVLILAIVGLVMPDIWISVYSKPSTGAATTGCWYQTGVKADKIGATTSYYSDFVKIAGGSPCKSETSDHYGLFGVCTKAPKLVKDSCKWSMDANTPSGKYNGVDYSNSAPMGAKDKFVVSADKSTGIYGGCLYNRPDEYDCKSYSDLSDQLDKQIADFKNSTKPMIDKMAAGPMKTAALKAYNKAMDGYDKMSDRFSVMNTAAGLYLTSLALHGLAFLVLVVASVMGCMSMSSKLPLLATAGLHVLAGLFFMITGAYMAGKMNDYRKEKNWTGNGTDEQTGAWDVTFAATWTCWLFGWVCAALAAFQSTKTDNTAAMEAKPGGTAAV